jgi:hypothetical protein
MQLTKESEYLHRIFSQTPCIPNQSATSSTKTILHSFYDSIKIANKDAKNLLPSLKINETKEIPFPKTFNERSFPTKVLQRIKDFSIGCNEIEVSLKNRNYKVFFVFERKEDTNKIMANVELVLTWLSIIDSFNLPCGSESVCIYFYFTQFLKELPIKSTTTLDENHVNTAFTYSCAKQMEIIIYRIEDWFKCFIHETFHSFGLDFSSMDTDNAHMMLKTFFPVNTDINLYEAYTEFWAQIWNTLFCSFFSLKNNKQSFQKKVLELINLERKYSVFQLVKTMDFMGLRYMDCVEKTNQCKNQFREKTSVLSYYIIKTILTFFYNDFFLWCIQHNKNPIYNFKKTNANLQSFVQFIQLHYNLKEFESEIHCMEEIYKQIDKLVAKQPQLKYLMKTMKMTLCEMG